MATIASGGGVGIVGRHRAGAQQQPPLGLCRLALA
jgi:hypothetical protein